MVAGGKRIELKDSDGNDWYEVESLAQDIIYDDVENTAEFDENLAAYNETVPYILKLIRTQKRYKTKIDIDKKTILQFGSGTATAADEEVIPNPTTVGNSFTNSSNLVRYRPIFIESFFFIFFGGFPLPKRRSAVSSSEYITR